MGKGRRTKMRMTRTSIPMSERGVIVELQRCDVSFFNFCVQPVAITTVQMRTGTWLLNIGPYCC